LEKHRLVDKIRLLREMPAEKINDILKELGDDRLVMVNIAGNYMLIPEMGFYLFPATIHTYGQLLDRSAYSFYSTSARLQEIQQLLIAYFTGERSLLLQPVRKIEFELTEYFPYLCFFLYFPAYDKLLRIFSEESVTSIYAAAIKYATLEMPLISDVN